MRDFLCKKSRKNFNPRSPHGERRSRFLRGVRYKLFQSTLPARGAPRRFLLVGAYAELISIHAPRTGSDSAGVRVRENNFYFNPRSPHGERRQPFQTQPTHQRISIHAPRTGSDTLNADNVLLEPHFNPRSPHGERRRRMCAERWKSNFNPRSPHGERQGAVRGCCELKQFQSTLPARGATAGSPFSLGGGSFQSTLPARGATPIAPHVPSGTGRFQSTLPARGATIVASGSSSPMPFQSTLPARGATRHRLASALRVEFQSTLPARGATPSAPPCLRLDAGDFNPRSPHGERHCH